MTSMRTEPFLSSIAFLLVEPGSSGLHFESGGTEEFAVWGVGVVENVMSSGVEGDVGFPPLGCDVLVDIPGVERGIGEENGGFESIGEEFLEEGSNAGDIAYVGGVGGFGQDDESDAGGSGEEGGFESPEEPGELLSFRIFVGGGFGAETGIGVACGDAVFLPSIFDELLGVVLTDVCPDLFDITGYRAIEELQAVDLLDGLLQEDLEEGILHPLDLRSEVSIGGDDLFPRWGGGGKVHTLFLGPEADGEGQCRMLQEEPSQSAEGGDLLIDHDEVGFEEGFERDAGGGACGEEREVEDAEETLISSHQGIVLDPGVQTGTPIAVWCGTGRVGERLWEQQQEAFQSVKQQEGQQENVQHPLPEDEHPDSVLEGSGARKPAGRLPPRAFLEPEFYKQDPVSGSFRDGSTRPDQDPQDHQHPYAAMQQDRQRHVHGIAPFASEGEEGGAFRYLTGGLSHNIPQRRPGR